MTVLTDEDDDLAALPKLEIRGRDRVRELAEVFTHEREVNAMLDLVADSAANIESRFLEPSCGNGNFLVAILHRKLETVHRNFRQQKDFEFNSLKALASIYGVDIDSHNVKEARERMHAVMLDFYSNRMNTTRPTEGYLPAVDYILKKNIIPGDMLNGVNKIKFTEFSSPKIYKFQQRVFKLADLMEDGLFGWMGPAPVQEIAMKHYWELAKK